MRSLGAVACAALALVSCASADSTPAPRLDGTSWELVTLQSMDDDQGTTAVPDPNRYTVTFGADGRAMFRIDCNRGSATWEATPGATGASGQLTFGPIASTRMACPPPTIDQEVSRALGFVRGYLIEGDHLHLSLLADAGILTWEPAEEGKP
jgi:heat shock protein HslJ